MAEYCKLYPALEDKLPLFQIVAWRQFTWRWVVVATDSDGKRVIARASRTFRAAHSYGKPVITSMLSSQEDMNSTREELVAYLVRTGWQPLDSNFYDQSFYREVSNTEKQGKNVASSAAKRLEHLEELRKKNLISAAEYRNKREEILSDL